MQVPPARADQVHGVLDHRQRLQAEKVELHQPGLFHPLHVVLRGRHVGGRIAVQRHQLVQRPVPDDHARRVGRGVAVEPLDLRRIVEHPLDVFLGRRRLAQARLVGQRLGDRDGLHAFHRDHLRQLVALGEAHAQHAAHVMHGGLGQKRAEGDDLAHLLAPVFPADVVDDLLAPVHAEVDVEVRHRDALGVQEALEQQRIAQGVEVGDRQRIGHQRPRARAPARPDRDALPLGPLDEVGHDQEVAGEAHLLDDPQLEVEPGIVVLDADGMGDHGKASGKALARLPAQFLDLVIGETRQDRLVLGNGKGAALRDLHRVGGRLGQVGEQDQHVLFRLEVVVRGQAAAGRGLVHHRAFPDADQRVMGAEHLGLGEIHVVRRHQRQVQRIGEVDHPALAGQFRLHQLAVVLHVALQFHIQPVAEHGGQIAQVRFGIRHLARRHHQPQRPAGATGQADQPLGVLAKLGHGHMGKLARGRHIQAGGQRHQVHPPLLALRQQHDRPAHRARVQRHLAADDGLDALVHGLHRELQRGEQRVGVGQRDGRHPVPGGKARQLLDGDRALKQRMLGMTAQVDELGQIGHGPLLAPERAVQKVAPQLPARHMGGRIAVGFAKTVSTGAAIISRRKHDCVNAETG